jgi:hypothetical protein
MLSRFRWLLDPPREPTKLPALPDLTAFSMELGKAMPGGRESSLDAITVMVRRPVGPVALGLDALLEGVAMVADG